MKRIETEKYAEIQKVVTALENPGTNEKIDELNQKISDYFDNVQQPLNLSFWLSVSYQYWSFNNLSKLLGMQFDVDFGYDLRKFEEKVRAVQKLRLNNASPRFTTKAAIPRPVSQPNKNQDSSVLSKVITDDNNADSEEDNIDTDIPKEFENGYSVPKVIGCACLAILAAWFTCRWCLSTNSQ